MDPVVQFTSTLFASRTQAHIFHLQTTSYAQHIALGEYYGGIVDLVDGLTELIKVDTESLKDTHPLLLLKKMIAL